MWSLLQALPRRLGVALCLALALFTSHKLYSMCRLRGFVGARQLETHYVTRKWIEHDLRNRRTCYVSWAEGPREDDEQHRAQCDCDFWQTTNVDDRLETVRLDEDDRASVRGGEIFASDGNFLFDLVLFGLELFGVFYYLSRDPRPKTA